MYRIGVNFDLEYITAGIVDADSKEIIGKKESIPTLKYRSVEAVTKDIADLCIKVCENGWLDMEKDIEYIGIGCHGAIDIEKGILIHTSWMEHFENAEIVKEVKKYINKDVYLEQNANCYALAESRIGVTKEYKNSVVLILGKGITGGIILDGKIYHGSFFGAGEFGHHVIIYDGEECTCGRKGCWSAYASHDALVRDGRIMAVRHPESLMFRMVNGDIRLLGVDTIYKAEEQGDKYAAEVLENYAKYVSLGMVNIINILQPAAIAFGGRMSKNADHYIDFVRKIVREKVFGQEDENRRTKILYASMTDCDGIIVGASMLKD